MFTLIEIKNLKKLIENLNKKQKIAEIFEIFKKNKSFSQQEIISKIYATAPYPEVSLRLWESTRAKTTKLLSRARKEAKKVYVDQNKQVKWFPYDKDQKTWKLYEIVQK